MKLCHWFLRVVSPRTERDRREFRKEIARTEAYAEEFCRTVSTHVDKLPEVGRKPQLP